jgi:hypothetical protein
MNDTADGFTSTGVTFHTHTSDDDSFRGFSAQEFNWQRGTLCQARLAITPPNY